MQVIIAFMHASKPVLSCTGHFTYRVEVVLSRERLKFVEKISTLWYVFR